MYLWGVIAYGGTVRTCMATFKTSEVSLGFLQKTRSASHKFDMIGWFATMLIGMALNIVAYLIMPKSKAPKPPEVADMDNPTNDTGSPIMVVWGSPRIKGLHILHTTNKLTVKKTYKEGGKK